MTGRCSKNIAADSLTGMIFAAEGIKNSIVLLNGPMGCKFYHSTTSRFLTVRPAAYITGKDGEKMPVDYNFLNNYFFRQERVPCTYLDGYDYVFGTAQKVTEALLYLKENLEFDLITIINSPGASLIGDSLEETARNILPEKPCVILESPGFSESFDSGYESAALEILKQIKLNRKDKKCRCANGSDPSMGSAERSVNILGLSIWDRYNEGDKEELERLLKLCGIRVNCFLCSGLSLDEIRNIPCADLNIVINSRFGNLCAEYLNKEYKMESLICTALPVGFEETEKLFKDICERLGKDAGPVLKESEKKRALSWYKINDIYQMCGKPDGTLFALEGSASQVLGYSRFFMGYLGMTAETLAVTGEISNAQATLYDELLKKYAAQYAAKKNILDTKAELIFSDANTISSLSLTGRPFCGIEISNPGMGYTDIIPKTHLGINGALFLIEQVINGLMSKL